MFLGDNSKKKSVYIQYRFQILPKVFDPCLVEYLNAEFMDIEGSLQKR